MNKNKALSGKRILITRPIHQSGALAEALRQYGAKITELPLLRISAPESWQDFDQAMINPANYQWLLFASSNAVESTLERLKALGLNKEALSKKRIACIGSATAECLQEHGLRADFIPSRFVAESFAEEFCHKNNSESNKTVLWLRTNIGRKLLKDELEKCGWHVQIAHSYQSAGPENPQNAANELYKMLEQGLIDVITLSSSQTARNLREILDLSASQNKTSREKLLARVRIAAIGPETAKTCREVLGKVEIESKTHTMLALAESIADYFVENT